MRIVRTEGNPPPLDITLGEVYEGKAGNVYVLGSIRGTKSRFILTSLSTGVCIELDDVKQVRELLESKGAVHKDQAVLHLNGDN